MGRLGRTANRSCVHSEDTCSFGQTAANIFAFTALNRKYGTIGRETEQSIISITRSIDICSPVFPNGLNASWLEIRDVAGLC